MDKIRRNAKRSLADFTSKLAAKWRVGTLPVHPDQPKSDDEMLAILTRLVGTPTITGNVEANRDALDYIEDFLRKRGLYITRIDNGGVESLVATTQDTKTPIALLGAHLDVVPADKELFELREEDGKLYGRGTLDMKYAIAAYMQTLDTLKHPLTDYNFGIMITTDEEAGGMDGTAKIVQEGYLPKVCILPDGGDDWQVQLQSKGFLYLSLTATGKAAHASRPWLGKNAISAIIGALQEIELLFPNPSEKTSTVNFGKLQGGHAPNQVADAAEALIDIRFTSSAEREHILVTIEKICKKHDVTVSVVMNGNMTKFDLANPYIAPFAELITEITGVKVTGSFTLGANDTRYFAEHDIPCISVYPPGAGHHGTNEWISKEGLYHFQKVVQAYLEKMAR